MASNGGNGPRISWDVLRDTLRALLVSSLPSGLTGEDLQNDFAMLRCRPIPFPEFGFASPDALFRSLSDIMVPKRVPGGREIRYFPISHPSTKHLERLVAQQRPSKLSRIGGTPLTSQASAKVVSKRQHAIKENIVEMLKASGRVNYTEFLRLYWETYGERFEPIWMFGTIKASTVFSRHLRDVVEMKQDRNGQIFVGLRWGSGPPRTPHNSPVNATAPPLTSPARTPRTPSKFGAPRHTRRLAFSSQPEKRQFDSDCTRISGRSLREEEDLGITLKGTVDSVKLGRDKPEESKKELGAAFEILGIDGVRRDLKRRIETHLNNASLLNQRVEEQLDSARSCIRELEIHYGGLIEKEQAKELQLEEEVELQSEVEVLDNMKDGNDTVDTSVGETSATENVSLASLETEVVSLQKELEKMKTEITQLETVRARKLMDSLRRSQSGFENQIERMESENRLLRGNLEKYRIRCKGLEEEVKTMKEQKRKEEFVRKRSTEHSQEVMEHRNELSRSLILDALLLPEPTGNVSKM